MEKGKETMAPIVKLPCDTCGHQDVCMYVADAGLLVDQLQESLDKQTSKGQFADILNGVRIVCKFYKDAPFKSLC